MLGDRYVTTPPGGLLYYLKGNHMQGLATLPHEKRGTVVNVQPSSATHVYVCQTYMILESCQ